MPLTTLAVDFEVLDDIPPGTQLHVCPINGEINGHMFYTGALTNVADVYDQSGKLSNNIGPGLVLTRWGTTDRAAIRPAQGGLYYAGDHEGNHVSPRLKYNWGRGRYTVEVARLDTETIDGVSYTWVGSFVTSHATQETVSVGAVRFKGKKLKLRESFAAFVELYHWNVKLRPSVPKLRVGFGNLRLNGEPAEPMVVAAGFPERAPPLAAVHSAHDYLAANKLPAGTLPDDEWAVVVDVGDKPLKRTGKPEIIHPLDWAGPPAGRKD